VSATGAPPAPDPAPANPPGTTPLPPVKRQRSRAGLIAVVIVVILVVAGILAVGYEQKWFGGRTSTTPEAACATGVELLGNGAQIVNPLMSVWTADYATATGNPVNYVDGGSGTGLTDFSESPPLIDFAIADNPLSSAQRSAMPSQPLTLPIVAGAITVIYNLPGVSGHLNLTGAILADVYNGTITTWNDAAITAINPDVTLPAKTIVTVHRADSAGTSYVFTDFLSQDSSYWNETVGKGLLPAWPDRSGVPDQTAVKGNSLMLSTVASTNYAIGYSDLTDTLTYTPALQYAAIENPKGTFVLPTLADTASAIADRLATTTLPDSAASWYNVSMVNANGAGDYSLATFIYLYVYQSADKGYSPSLPRAQVIVQWLDYVLSAGAQALTDATSPTELYYVALPASVIAVDTAGIQTMTFNGAAIPACS
jgi:phosphate transport system substrate-binding protein